MHGNGEISLRLSCTVSSLRYGQCFGKLKPDKYIFIQFLLNLDLRSNHWFMCVTLAGMASLVGSGFWRDCVQYLL